MKRIYAVSCERSDSVSILTVSLAAIAAGSTGAETSGNRVMVPDEGTTSIVKAEATNQALAASRPVSEAVLLDGHRLSASGITILPDAIVEHHPALPGKMLCCTRA